MQNFNIRRRGDREATEASTLSPGALLSVNSQGRAIPEEPDEFRTAFEMDRDRILHSKAFRRLKHKTQVFVNPEDDHFVTRLTHTLQVTQIGTVLAAGLGLNEPLTEAICLGHDAGHSPFGHTGEDVLSEFIDGDEEWLHSAHGVRLLSILEPLNLTAEVLDGIRAHSWKIDPHPTTAEGYLCRFADRIAYLTHDVDDALRAGVLALGNLPASSVSVLGEPGSGWIDTMVRAVIEESARQGRIVMEPSVLEVMHELRAFMFEWVYLRGDVHPQKDKVRRIVRDLVNYYANSPEKLPDGFLREGDTVQQNVIDFVAGMTDRFAVRHHDDLFRPVLFE